MKLLFTIIACVGIITNTFSQNELVSLINNNTTTFNYHQNKFKGDGWNNILSAIKKHDNILIGEDHFFEEIPLFISQINNEIHFDNFFCEIDAYTASIIQQQLLNKDVKKVTDFISNYNTSFSFYALEKEFDLLQKFVSTKTNIIGLDQVTLTADRLIAFDLLQKTTHNKTQEIYKKIITNSKKHFDLFITGKGSPYFFTNDFIKKLQQLDSLQISDYEKKAIDNILLSHKIYTTQSHQLRIQHMKHNILNHIQKISKQKNLFKYGAIHMNKSESLLGGFDIGNFIANISEANYKKSLHLMIIGKDGIQGVPFKGMKTQKLNTTNGELQYLSPFFNSVTSDEWHVFNLNEIKKSIKKNNIQVGKKLEKTINGFDYLIVIPKVNPAKFLN